MPEPINPDPRLAEVVLKRILEAVDSQKDDMQILGMIKSAAVGDTAAMSPQLRNDFIQQHLDALEWWLSGDWAKVWPVFVYGTPPAAPPASVERAKLITAGQERQQPGGAPQEPRLSPRDSVDSVTGYDEQVG